MEIFEELEKKAKPILDLLNEKYDINTRIVIGLDSIKVVRDEISVPIKLD